MQIKWFKDKDDSLWFHDFVGKTIYAIFGIPEKKCCCVGVYRNTRTSRKDKTLINDKPLFYDGFTLNQAKELVKNMVGGYKNGKENKRIRRIKRNSK